LLIQVSPSLNIFENFTYEFRGNEADIGPGMRVVIPVGNRISTGWGTGLHSAYSGKVKRIIGIINDLILPGTTQMEFSRAVSESYFVSLGMVLDYSLPPRWKSIHHLLFSHGDKDQKLIKWSLNDLEKLSRDSAIRFFYRHENQKELPERKKMTDSLSFQYRLLLDDDRLNRYRDLIHEASGKNQCVLFITPDQLTALFFSRLLDGMEWYHSRQKPAERERIWFRAVKGKCLILAGGLSAIMVPVKNPGCIICERAGSTLYQKSAYSDFNLNHIARLKAEKEKVPFIEGFSTFNSRAYLHRNQIQVEDHRQDRQVTMNIRRLPSRERGIPEQLLELLKMYFLEKKKILLVVHRKKSSSYLFCPSCKKIQSCPVCHGFLKISHENGIACSRCDFRAQSLRDCSTCRKELVELKDISVSGMRDVIQKKLTESGVFTLTADNTENIDSVVETIGKRQIVISTTVVINPFFKNMFDVVIYFRPESVFSMNDFNTGEMIFSMVSELKELVREKGIIDIFSVFHFHYSLQLVADEEKFFQRELKYRSWFSLPPYCNVYALEMKSNNLRKLGAEMRNIYGTYGNILNIKHIYLISRKKIRGNYKGRMECHTFPETVMASNILSAKRLLIQLLAV
jgi:primosomal protein N'